mmetsp:Transcript_53455/g.124491  ORF Transcript_53455/g.124491 Transcript_53455/m.124491 type:complete len:235 (+) Transcript_53455:248-952(+)
MSLPDTVGDTQDSSGPMPLIRFTLSRLPDLFASTSSRRAPSLYLPHSSDFNASPFLARQPCEDLTNHSFFFATSPDICTYFWTCKFVQSARGLYLSAKSMFHLANNWPGSLSFLVISQFFSSLALRASFFFFHWPLCTSFDIQSSRNFTVKPTPSSFCIISPSRAQFCRMVGSSQHFLILAPSSLAESCDRCTVPSPLLSAASFFAMSFWSAKTGVTMVGTPALREACVVPMPP